jgi:site-specific DNA-methyltransferase (adenine-specific)
MIDTIIQGDCLEVMPSIPDKSIDMILCDLPYGTTACKWDTIIPFEPLWAQYKRLIKDRGAIVLTASQPFTSALVMSNPYDFKYSWYWKKRPVNFLNAKKQPMRNIEDILVFNAKQYNSQGLIQCKKINKRSNSTETSGLHGLCNESNFINYPHQVLEIINGERGLHPTQKPVALMEYLIKTYTDEGDLVLDNCIGSGTTAVAAKRTGRHFIGIELLPEYCQIAEKRLSQLPQTLNECLVRSGNA